MKTHHKLSSLISHYEIHTIVQADMTLGLTCLILLVVLLFNYQIEGT